MAEDKEALSPKERQISFGQVVLVKQGNDEKTPERFVVLDTQKESGFIHTAKILQGENNEKVLGGMGGAKPEDIKEILDEKWTLEEIANGVRNRFNYKELPKEMQEFLKTASQKTSRKNLEKIVSQRRSAYFVYFIYGLQEEFNFAIYKCQRCLIT